MRAGRVVLGIVLVVAGSLILLDRSGALDAGGVLATFWPVAIVLLGLWQFAYDRNALVGAAAIVAVGLGLLALTSGAIDSGVLRVAWPIAILALGVWVLLGRPAPRPPGISGEDPYLFVALGSRRRDVTLVGLREGAATVIAGQGTVDLTGATLDAGGAELSATVIGGGLDVIVPKGWDVRVSGLPLLGSWVDTTRPNPGSDAPVLSVKALVILGGIEVRYAARWE